MSLKIVSRPKKIDFAAAGLPFEIQGSAVDSRGSYGQIMCTFVSDLAGDFIFLDVETGQFFTIKSVAAPIATNEIKNELNNLRDIADALNSIFLFVKNYYAFCNNDGNILYIYSKHIFPVFIDGYAVPSSLKTTLIQPGASSVYLQDYSFKTILGTIDKNITELRTYPDNSGKCSLDIGKLIKPYIPVMLPDLLEEIQEFDLFEYFFRICEQYTDIAEITTAMEQYKAYALNGNVKDVFRTINIAGTPQVETITIEGKLPDPLIESAQVESIAVEGTVSKVVDGAYQVETASIEGTIYPEITGVAQIEETIIVGTASTMDGANQIEFQLIEGTIDPVTAGANQVEQAQVFGDIGEGSVFAGLMVTTDLIGGGVYLQVPVDYGDNANTVALKMRNALLGSEIINYFAVGGTGRTITLTSLTKRANDETLNINIFNDNCTGLVDSPTSTTITAGQAQTSGSGNATVVVSSSLFSPVTLQVAVIGGDNANTIADKIKSVLSANSSISTNYTVGGSLAGIFLTAKVRAANDNSLNISVTNGTCSGLVNKTTSETIVPGFVSGGATGNLKVIFTSEFFAEKTINVTIAHGDGESVIGSKIRAALSTDTDVSEHYTISGAGCNVIATAKVAKDNDFSLNMAIHNDTTAGIYENSTSNNLVSGVAYYTGAGIMRAVITSSLFSTQTLNISVTASEENYSIAAKVRDAINANSTINAYYSAGGTGKYVVLTANAQRANDAALNIEYYNYTSFGLDHGISSENTTAGFATDAGTGNAIITITSALFATQTINVTLTHNDSAAAAAGKMRTAISANSTVATYYNIGGSGANIVLTAKAAAANDASLNIAYANDTITGLIDKPTSDNTTAGAIGESNNGNASVTITSALLTGNQKIITVALSGGDNASQIAVKMRAALAGDSGISPIFTIGGSAADITLTTKQSLENDNTLNIAYANVTCTGLIEKSKSTNTTAGRPGESIEFIQGFMNSLTEIELWSGAHYWLNFINSKPEAETCVVKARIHYTDQSFEAIPILSIVTKDNHTLYSFAASIEKLNLDYVNPDKDIYKYEIWVEHANGSTLCDAITFNVINKPMYVKEFAFLNKFGAMDYFHAVTRDNVSMVLEKTIVKKANGSVNDIITDAFPSYKATTGYMKASDALEIQYFLKSDEFYEIVDNNPLKCIIEPATFQILEDSSSISEITFSYRRANG